MPEKRKTPLLPLIVAAIAALVLGVVLLQGGDEQEDSPVDVAPASASAASPESWEQLVRRDADDPMALGEPDAPVVMVAYSEFQCPFCGKFARDTEPVLVEKFVEDGTLRIEWRDFPYLGAESTVAARGGRAAAAQDRFWEFEEAMYADQLPPNSGDLDEDYLVSVAEDIGLDVDRFREDLDSPEAERAVQDDFAEGQAIGVTGTPAFVINGVPVIGAQPTEVFERTIEKAAEEAGR
ncbi:thioredoxin domain-containing protein [uncultured Nocardioides sp.]|uniref:DsbA family protein n=1 Tax=uncultured Nocardioides sp. TaxID=198441 RepID=UPI0026129845|nr:thioredoxin domain-containing protein [uncultured Nocardioides sp.]